MNVFLRAFEMDDLPLINKWHNDEDINSLTGGNKYFVSSYYDKRWLEDKMLNNKDNIYCAICKKKTGNMIGYVSLNDIDYRNRKALWGGIVIGDKESRNKGYASNATFQLLQYAFEELGLNKVTGNWLQSHKTSLLLGQLFGFKKEGVLRSEVFKGGEYHNVVIMSMLKQEYQLLKQNYGNIK
jgi:RimJ/RimL family protein N-acetyltransferase